jgi:hypothetical protein
MPLAPFLVFGVFRKWSCGAYQYAVIKKANVTAGVRSSYLGPYFLR